MLMAQLDPPPRYRAYLLRCWQERSQASDQKTTVWRFSLEDPHTGQRRGFASFETLIAALRTELSGADVQRPPHDD
jgi:hypothetical protein